MIYYSTRVIIIIIIWVGFILKFKSRFTYNLATTKKRFWVLVYSVTISYILFSIMIYLPIESLFVRFNTAEEAFAYSNVGYKIDKIIAAKDCAFVIYTRSSEHTVDYLNKNGNKWLMVKPTLYRNEKLTGNDNYDVWFLENASTMQLLVLITQIFPSPTVEIDQTVISDSQNSDFERFQVLYEKFNLKTYYYYHVIDVSNHEHYEVVIDGASFTYNK